MHLNAIDYVTVTPIRMPNIVATGAGTPKPVISTTPVAASSSSGSGGGFFSNLLNALPNIASAGLQVYGAVQQAKYLSQAGINPYGFTPQGQPIYASTPSGVTPNNPYQVPSGGAVPNGVTPNNPYQVPSGGAVPNGVTPNFYPMPFGQPASTTIVQQPAPLSNLFSSGNMMPMLLIGGGSLLLMMVMMRGNKEA